MDWVPSGSLFLPKVTLTELKNLYKKERNSKAKIRILCAILRKRDYSISEIVKHTELPRMTVSDYLRRLHETGMENLYDKKQTGRPTKLSKEQINELEVIFQQTPQEQDLPFIIWTTKIARDLIETKYRIAYKPRQTRNILRKMDFSPQKPRPQHRKAPIQAQEDFKKSSKNSLDHTQKLDMRSYSWMKASSQ